MRARVTVLFALGAFLLSAAMGTVSYVIVRHVLVGEQESYALDQAFVNASRLRSELLSPFTATKPILDLLQTPNASTAGSSSVLERHGQFYASPIVKRSAIPVGLSDIVRGGSAATQTYDLATTPTITVGVPIPSVKALYFEIFDEAPLSHTLRVLLLALLGAGVVTTALGAVVGRSASTGSLRPLTSVSRAAVAIAGGRLDTRLSASPGDPDLEGLTASFNRMVDQLQERIEREARFTSDVSHELRSPLTTMSASLDVLEAHAAELSPTGAHALDLLAADLRRFRRLVGELLEISRSDTGSADVSLEEVDPGELARHSVAAATRSLPPGNALPVVEVDPSLEGLRLWVDKRRFERVMTNLLENAALYGGGAVRVTVTSSTPALPAKAASSRPRRAKVAPAATSPTVRFSVEDRGPGVAAAERGRVFQRFYRGQASGQRGRGTGTGLGLALVAEHVRLHGGSVWVEDAESGGARFVVELPATPAEPGGTTAAEFDDLVAPRAPVPDATNGHRRAGGGADRARDPDVGA